MRRTMAVMVAVLTTVALVGCSSSKKSSSTVAAGSNSSATTSGSSATTAASSSSGSSGSSGGGSTSNIKWCDNAATNSLIQQIQANATGNADTATKDYNLLKSYAANAPSAIKADVNTIVTFYGKFITFLNNDKGNPQKLVTDMQSVQADQAQLQAASQHISAWAATNCHS